MNRKGRNLQPRPWQEANNMCLQKGTYDCPGLPDRDQVLNFCVRMYPTAGSSVKKAYSVRGVQQSRLRKCPGPPRPPPPPPRQPPSMADTSLVPSPPRPEPRNPPPLHPPSMAGTSLDVPSPPPPPPRHPPSVLGTSVVRPPPSLPPPWQTRP